MMLDLLENLNCLQGLVWQVLNSLISWGEWDGLWGVAVP